MTKLLEEIYLILTETEKFKRSTVSDTEYKAYEAIYNTLTEKQKTLFEDFQELFSDRCCDDGERLFYEGFKVAVKLLLEALYE